MRPLVTHAAALSMFDGVALASVEVSGFGWPWSGCASTDTEALKFLAFIGGNPEPANADD
jgi:hypothetical protein